VGFAPKNCVLDGEYLLERAATEARIAAGSVDDISIKLHQELASAYIDRVFAAAPNANPLPEDCRSQANAEAMKSVLFWFARALIEPEAPREMWCLPNRGGDEVPDPTRNAVP
jgi:hypothetical protein